MRNKAHFSLSYLHSLMKRAGAERISDLACIELGNILEEIGLNISKDAWDYARHARRKTVKDRDIKRSTIRINEVMTLLGVNDNGPYQKTLR